MSFASIQDPDLSSRPVIGITLGDPLGIGPEILIKALQAHGLYRVCRPLVLGDPSVLKLALTRFEGSMQLNPVTGPEQGIYKSGCLDLMAVSDMAATMSDLAVMTPRIGRAMTDYIHTGVDLALEHRIAALVTCPITKTGMKLAGSPFHGHTELIAHLTGARKFAMMLAGDTLKVVLVTIHIPLSRVPKALTIDKIVDTIFLTRSALKQRFNIPNPRLAVAGLNPHAGEDGLFGTEELQIIAPAVHAARRSGMDIQGPLPPDTVFNFAMNTGCDAVICMYHDQGLIPFKLIHFKDGVNITLGLPIIRTSVDHGTAYDIAWQGKADPTSLVQAVRMAVFQARNRTDRDLLHG